MTYIPRSAPHLADAKPDIYCRNCEHRRCRSNAHTKEHLPDDDPKSDLAPLPASLYQRPSSYSNRYCGCRRRRQAHAAVAPETPTCFSYDQYQAPLQSLLRLCLPLTSTPTWTDIEWLRRAPAPVPEGNPDWVYDSMNGTIYGQVSHPDLLLDITMLQVNRDSCDALLYVVGDVGEPKNIPLYGAPLAAWVDKYGAGTEAPDFNLLARLTVAEYDAIVAEVGAPELDPYAETYGTTNLNPAAQREAEACAASSQAEDYTSIPDTRRHQR